MKNVHAIDVRRAANGYVITVVLYDWRRNPHSAQDADSHLTYVVEGTDPAAVGHGVAKVLAQHPITETVMIPIARPELAK